MTFYFMTKYAMQIFSTSFVLEMHDSPGGTCLWRQEGIFYKAKKKYVIKFIEMIWTALNSKLCFILQVSEICQMYAEKYFDKMVLNFLE